MSTRHFTEEEMNRLWASSYVLHVTPNKVHFSAEFKRQFWELLQTQKTPNEALIELGIDPDILGKTRIYGLKAMICKDVRD